LDQLRAQASSVERKLLDQLAAVQQELTRERNAR
jgi:hypothetical protein